MILKMSEHGHAAIGLKVTVSILPPKISIEPIVTFAYMSKESDRISKHEHELLELPSLGISWQQLMGNRFSAHSHLMEGIELGFEIGASTFTCTCTPPPIPDDSEKPYRRRNGNKKTSQSAFSTVRTKLCSKEQLISFLRNQLEKQVSQQIRRNEMEALRDIKEEQNVQQ
jgi:hypothetical protein